MAAPATARPGPPSQHDLIAAPIDLAPHLATAVAAAAPTGPQAQIIEALRGPRDAAAIARIGALQPIKAFESYAADALHKRSLGRIARIKRATAPLFDGRPMLRVLDIGAARGELLAYLCADRDAEVHGVGLDIDVGLFAQRRVEVPDLARLLFLHAPAERIPVADASFDLITAFNSMEHFDDPRAVVAECMRVLRPGGSVYFHFGPPWNSPFGPHLHNRFGLPYFHHLFDRDVIAQALGFSGNPYAGKNEWSTAAFVELFTGAPGYRCTRLLGEYTWDHLWIVRAFPEEFGHHAAEELVTRALEVVLRKPGEWQPIRPAATATAAAAPAISPAAAPPRSRLRRWLARRR